MPKKSSVESRRLPLGDTSEYEMYLQQKNRATKTPGLNRQKNLVEKLLSLLGSPDDPGLGPSELGMIPTVNNLDRFLTKFAINKTKILKLWDIPERLIKDLDPVAEAVAFGQTRYPNITSKVKAFYPRVSRDLNQTEVGKFMPEIEEALIDAKYQNKPINYEDLVNTVLHESRHALSYKRTPDIFNAEKFFRYNSPNLPLEEQNAYQAGATAKKAALNFMKLLENR